MLLNVPLRRHRLVDAGPGLRLELRRNLTPAYSLVGPAQLPFFTITH